MLRLNRSSAWLEALRVFPQYHQQGLGRLIAIFMIEVARKAGYQDLLFSTYFDNIGSIRINEALGFTKIATFTTLNLLIKDLSTIPAVTADHPDLSITDEVCRPDQITWNGWQFVLPNTDNLERFFPGVETITTNDSVMMIANNTKSPGQELEICWLEGPAAAGAGLCLEYAIAECHRRAIPRLHLMLPEAIPHEPFLRAGFTIYEQPKDVFVYRGTIEQLEC